MSAAKDIAHMLLFEADEFHPDEVEQVAAVRIPSRANLAKNYYTLGDEYHFLVHWGVGGREVGEWIMSRRHRPTDTEAVGMFVPNAFGEEHMGLIHTTTHGTRAEVLRDIDTWMSEGGDIEEAVDHDVFDPDEIDTVASAAFAVPYYEAVTVRPSSIRLVFDKQFNRLYSDIERKGRWKLSPDSLTRAKYPGDNRCMFPVDLVKMLETEEQFVGQIWVSFYDDNRLCDIRAFGGSIFKIRKIKTDGP